MSGLGLRYQGELGTFDSAGRSEVFNVETFNSLVVQPVVPAGGSVSFNVLGTAARVDDEDDVAFTAFNDSPLEEGDWFTIVDVGLVAIVIEVVSVSDEVTFFVTGK